MSEQDRELIGGTYQARFGPTVKGVSVVLMSAGFVAIAFLPGIPIVLLGVLLLLFGGGGLAFLFTLLSGRVALRVDRDGITLGGFPIWGYRRTTAFVPWAQITAVVLFEQRVPDGPPMPYIGLARREGAPRLPVIPGLGMTRVNAHLIPHVPPDIVAASRPINGWGLDRAQLIESVTRNAPEVPVLDLG
ncbi:hypothetical protein [Nocardia iowensis]|uniref:Uncharacterized protein n=1 Tax=Nocardia iowensis TaxID=204891 RepID=A0ABX8RTV4_NOCIO|nr:hypothetical protein [Nocardia iowensis]QXN93084.1 hypothetical protein KV110_08250 [Nocardia iowensis]